VVRLIAIVGWVSLIAWVILFVLEAVNKREALLTKRVPVPFRWKIYLLPVGIVCIFVSLFLVQIGAQEVGVMVTPSGIAQDHLETGWHLIPPWYHLELMDRTVWVYTFSNKPSEGQHKDADAIWVPTKDGIKMGMNVSVSWSIDPAFAPWILQNVSEADGGNQGKYLWIEENFIRAKAQSALALTVSEYTPIQVYSDKRYDIQQEAAEKLRVDLKTYHLILHQIDIREVFYNPQYEESINNKKLAEQEVLRLVEVTKQKQEQLKQAMIDKDIVIQKAEGESKALQIKGMSISGNPKIIQLEWINKWNGELPRYMLGSAQGIILNPTEK
jgi:regulator of protease activity HflC (stomatin/prohibitin superfamily)